MTTDTFAGLSGAATSSAAGPLAGLVVVDLSRILAGPVATQMLGDLGATILKVEQPGRGDDTRSWGPPYLKDAHGRDTSEAGYYLSINRNKHSIAIDIAKPEGQALVRRLLAKADVLIENFKAGGLAGYGLDYPSLAPAFPRLVYCSITGFGQTGPYAPRAGYDYLVQGMGGVMSVTGTPDGEPMKVGIAVSDIMTGMHACIAILAALRHRDATGVGQHIDLALLDSTVFFLANQGLNYLLSGTPPGRLGNAHPNIVPYQVFAAADGHFILAVGNDEQYRRFCGLLDRPDLAEPPYATNRERVQRRAELVPLLAPLIQQHTKAFWLDACAREGIPASPINDIAEVFADSQVQARGMQVEMQHPASPDPLPLIGNPIKLSATPPSYRLAPPMLGQHTDSVLLALGLSEPELADLRAARIIA
ncbi:MAG: CoA transferase [Alphaproteobacteria bacterium]|nr:MAG: CoA transferase [Alphaproteobacteria bacterium]